MKTGYLNKLSLMSLYQVGAQRGNKKSKLNPRIKSSVYSVASGLCQIDLADTMTSLQNACDLLYKAGIKKRQVIVVGTSKHMKNNTSIFAAKFGDGKTPFVENRWLGGLLSNWPTIRKTLKTLDKLVKIEENQEFFDKLSKNEQLNLVKKKNKILKFFRGLTHLKNSRPAAVIVLDAAADPIAIQEAEAANVPIITLANTGAVKLPVDLSTTIVTNVNSIKAVSLIVDELVAAYNAGFTYVQPVEEKEEVKVVNKK